MRGVRALGLLIVTASLISCGDQSVGAPNAESTLEAHNSSFDLSDSDMSDVDRFFRLTDFEKYIGREVGELLADVPFQIESQRGFDEPPGKLAGVAYKFSSGYIIEVETHELKYTAQFDLKRQWDLKNFSHEQIAGIAVRRFAPQPPYNRIFGDVYRKGAPVGINK